jgi:hypothetical protein
VLERPARVVADGRTWFHVRGQDSYSAMAVADLGGRTLDELALRYGRWSAVVPATGEQVEQACRLVTAAGRRAAISTAAAVAEVERELGAVALCAPSQHGHGPALLLRLARLGREAAGARLDEAAVRGLAQLVRAWVAGEGTVTDVGAALGEAFALAADAWRDGWHALADDALLPDGAQAHEGEMAHLLLMGESHQWRGDRYRG